MPASCTVVSTGASAGRPHIARRPLVPVERATDRIPRVDTEADQFRGSAQPCFALAQGLFKGVALAGIAGDANEHLDLAPHRFDRTFRDKADGCIKVMLQP